MNGRGDLLKMDITNRILKEAVVRVSWPVCIALLAAGCANHGPGVSSKDGSAVENPPSRVNPEATANHIPAVVKPDERKATSKTEKGLPYSVNIVPTPLQIRGVGTTEHATITIHNMGRAIPALSLCFDSVDQNCTIRSARSDRSAHPAPVMADTGVGWDFGPLPHGATTHITLDVAARRAGKQSFMIKPYAVAEDEGDTERSIDKHIDGSDKTLTVWVRSSSNTTGA